MGTKVGGAGGRGGQKLSIFVSVWTKLSQTILILGIVLYSIEQMKKLEYFVSEYDLTRTIEVSISSENQSCAQFAKIPPTIFGT